MIRVLILLAAIPAALIINANADTLAPPAIFAALTVVTLVMPASAGPALLIAYAALVMTFAEGHPLRLGVLAMIPLLHLIHITSGLAAVVGMKTKVEPSALKAPARRFAIVQAITFGVAAFAAVVPNGPNTGFAELVGLAALTVVIGVVALRI